MGQNNLNLIEQLILEMNKKILPTIIKNYRKNLKVFKSI